MAKPYQVRQALKAIDKLVDGITMNRHDRYTYRVIWSEEDEMYRGPGVRTSGCSVTWHDYPGKGVLSAFGTWSLIAVKVVRRGWRPDP